MGLMQRVAMANQENYEEARDLLVETGTLEKCQEHPGTYFDGDGDLERAYKKVNTCITFGVIDLRHGETRRDYTDRLKDVYIDNSGISGCQECEDHFGA